MPTGITIKTPENVETFINMILLGVDAKEVCERIGMARQTYYAWLNDSKIIGEIDNRRAEIKTEGINYIKGRYKRYLDNIDKLCKDFTDKRVALSANQFMVEKIDGKNVARVEDVTPEKIEIRLED